MIIDRFWRYCEQTNKWLCWEWLGALDRDGYPRITIDGMSVNAAKYAYEQIVAPIPKGLHTDHLCRNKKCVNPTHIEPVTPAENNRRRLLYYNKVTVCKRGHKLISDNIYKNGKNSTTCKICKNEKRSKLE